MSAAAGTVPVVIEVGCEEIPHRFVPDALAEVRARFAAALAEAGLAGGEVTAHGGPRRLAALAPAVLARQADRDEEIVGPPVSAAFKDGRPTPAAEGFARKAGVEVAALTRVHDGKAERVAARRKVAGRPAVAVLGEIAPPVFDGLPWPKNMRWGDGGRTWVRPVHWVVALAGEEVIPLEMFGIRSGRTSRGHRTRSQGDVAIRSAATWLSDLREASVLADRGERRARVEDGLRAAAARARGALSPDPDLLDAACDLVEWPVVVEGRFPERYLALPGVVLEGAMRHHQKFFALHGEGGDLLPRFLHVANQEDPAGTIAANNASVLVARFDDATFFHANDVARPLESRLPDLERVLFHEKLGTYADKVRRMERLAREAHALLGEAGRGVSLDALLAAVRACKADQTTDLVKELTELQGVMGGLHLRREGAPEATWRAVAEHYRPESTSDRVASTPEGALLSVVDRADTLVGCFGVGLVPTGSKDPFGLRRAAQGLLRTCLESPLGVPIRPLLEAAAKLHAGAPGFLASRVESDLVPYLEARLRHLLSEGVALRAGGGTFAPEEVRACMASSWERLPDLLARLEALATVRERRRDDFAALAVAFKRVRNILKGQEAGAVDPAALEEPAEKALARRLAETRAAAEPLMAAGDHVGALSALAALRPDVDALFDQILVMAEDPAVRRNRVALLQGVLSLFHREADVSEIAADA